MANFCKLREVLQNVKSVGISGHVRPDGDCVGSTMAVYNFIKNTFLLTVSNVTTGILGFVFGSIWHISIL